MVMSPDRTISVSEYRREGGQTPQLATVRNLDEFRDLQAYKVRSCTHLKFQERCWYTYQLSREIQHTQERDQISLMNPRGPQNLHHTREK